MRIDIIQNGYIIDGKTFLYPVNVDDLKQLFGSGRIYEMKRDDGKQLTFVVWDQSGLSADISNDEGIVWRLMMSMSESNSQKGLYSEQVFTGCITVEGKELKDIEMKRDDWFGEYPFGENLILIGFEKGEIEDVDIRTNRKRAEGKSKLKIDIQNSGICINGELFSYPLDLTAIRKCLALNPDEICEKDNEFDNGFSVGLNDKGKEKICIDLYYFNGQITINGKDYSKASKKKDRYGYSAEGIYGDSKVHYSLNHKDGSIKYIDITQFNYMIIEKYKPKQTDEETLTFKDLNFKLLVIDELMYEKELLHPKFDIYEFAEQYQKKDIDTGSEEPIKEALDYFKNYPIEKRFASEITELTQDGNEIYMNIAPQWDGEDSAFDIKSAQDAQQFPNLKKITLTSDHFSKLAKQFGLLGITAEQL